MVKRAWVVGLGESLRTVVAVVARLAVFAISATAVTIVVFWLLHPLQDVGVFGPLTHALASCVGLLAGTWVTLAAVDRRPLSSVGLHSDPAALSETARGLAFGVGITMATGIVLFGSGWLEVREAPGVVLAGFDRALGLTAFITFAAAAEELIFRGYPFQLVWRRWGLPSALALSAGLFAIAHMDNPALTPLALLNLALAGVLLALAYVKTRSLWFPIGVHAGWNWVLAVPLDQPVSGIVFGMPGYDVVETGPDLLTGGRFGPEGGLVVTGVTVAAIAWLARTSRVRPSAAALAAGPFPDAVPAGATHG